MAIIGRTPRALGCSGTNCVRLDLDQPFDRLHLAVHEQNIRDLDRLLTSATDRERQVASSVKDV